MKFIGITSEECDQVPTSISRWYDRSTRSWVVQLKDQRGNQIDNAYIVGTKKEAIDEEVRLKKEYRI